MSVFSDFEQKALRLLVGPVLGPATVDAIVRDAGLHERVILERAYQIEVTHPQLPVDHRQIESPVVFGRYEGLQVRFSATLKDRVLLLLCQSIDDQEIPDYFRRRDVVIARG